MKKSVLGLAFVLVLGGVPVFARNQADFVPSGLIDALFAGGADPTGPMCPTARGDMDCDGFTTALDLAVMIDHLFAGGAGPCDPCSP